MAEDFARAASRFCAVIEQGDTPFVRWLSDVEAALANVYASAVALPSIDPRSEVAAPRMSHEEWASLFDELRGRLGHLDAYAIVMGAGDHEAIVAASLADDLAAVYQQVRAGLDWSSSGGAPEDVLFEWRTSFEVHWAAHAVGALGAIRRVLHVLESDAP